MIFQLFNVRHSQPRDLKTPALPSGFYLPRDLRQHGDRKCMKNHV